MVVDRDALLARMKDAGGGEMALWLEAYDVLCLIAAQLERIADALERGGGNTR